MTAGICSKENKAETCWHTVGLKQQFYRLNLEPVANRLELVGRRLDINDDEILSSKGVKSLILTVVLPWVQTRKTHLFFQKSKTTVIFLFGKKYTQSVSDQPGFSSGGTPKRGGGTAQRPSHVEPYLQCFAWQVWAVGDVGGSPPIFPIAMDDPPWN